jgi:DNA-binding MarR family transcriptional regulator
MPDKLNNTIFSIFEKKHFMSARTVYLIKRIETEVTLRMNKALSEFDITLSQFIVLNFVNDNQTDFSSAQLSRRFKMTPQSMNETVSSLQKKELIIKNAAIENKRILRISLTEKGLEVLNACNLAINKVEMELFSCLTSDEMESFRALIGVVLSVTK